MSEHKAQPLAGKVVVVTGGTRGIGRATSLAFARRGALVTAAFRSDHVASELLVQEAQAAGHKLSSHQADISHSEEADRLIQSVIAAEGRVDILVNNAGLFPSRLVADMTDAEWDTVLRTNLYSVFYCCRAVLPVMQRQGDGAIVNIASVAGKRGSAYHAHYAASKGGLLAFTRSLAREAIQDGIRVNAVCPGRIATDLLLATADDSEQARWLADTAAKRLGTPEEVAAAILFLAGPDSGFIIGETIDVDGGHLMD